MKTLLEEAHRRSLWQILAAYAVCSWFVLGAAGTFMDVLGLPDWVPQLAGLICLALLPLVIATAWVEKATMAGAEAGTEQASAPWVRRWLQWRRVTVVAVVAFGALGTGTTGYMGMRLLGVGPIGTLWAQGTLDASDVIVLADFDDQAGDPLLASSVTAALRVDLSQSPTLRLADETYVSEVVRLMERDTDVPLDRETAREVAIREGLKAVLSGGVHAVGQGFVLVATLVVAESGDEVLSLRETAEEAGSVIPAIDRLSRRLRERLGESLKTVRQAAPLYRIRTSSLQALKLFQEAAIANAHAEFRQCVSLLTEAIALDTLFASAYAHRGACYNNIGFGSPAGIADYIRAHQLRDRVTAPEQAMIDNFYYADVRGEPQRAVEVIEGYLDRFSYKRTLALAILTDLHLQLRDYPSAESTARQGLEERPFPEAIGLNNLFEAVFNQGRFEEAEEILRRWSDELPGNPLLLDRLFRAASARGDYEGSRRLLDVPANQEYLRAAAAGRLALLARVEGRLREATSLVQETTWSEYGRLSWVANMRLMVAGDTATAVASMENALALLDSLPAAERPVFGPAEFFARAGQPQRARPLLAAWDSLADDDRQSRERAARRGLEGIVLLAEGRPEEAIPVLRFAHEQTSRSPIAFLAELGMAHELAGERDLAVAQYEHFLETPYYARVGYDSTWLPFVLERLAALYEERGDTAKAVGHYTRLVELWKDCDPELRPRVQAAQAAITRLQTGVT